MSATVGHELSGIIKWCVREEWRPHVDTVMADHFEAAMGVFRLACDGRDRPEVGGILAS
jgi:hypothetical protein